MPSLSSWVVAGGLSLVVACSHAPAAPGQPGGGEAPPDAAATLPPPIDAPAAAVVPYPDPDWPTGAPGDVGLDPAMLDAASAAAEASQSSCLLVIRHGVLVSEHYYNGATAASTPPSWSIAKSYTSTVVGIALGTHDLPGLDAKISDAIPAWQGSPRDAVVLRDLVSMTSGLAWSVFGDYIAMAELAPDKSSYAVGLSDDSAPGSGWAYNNAAVQVIEPYFRATTGESIEAYAQAHLWSKIGEQATWAHDGQGHPTTYANVLATCRDHARLGYLYLHGGKWKDEQVVPAAWVTAARTPSQAYNRGYGFLWWLNGDAPTMTTMQGVSPDRLRPYAPPDLFEAQGFGGQFINVIPSLDLVVVRFAKDAMTTAEARHLAPETQVLIADQTSDSHEQILQPILDAVTGP